MKKFILFLITTILLSACGPSSAATIVQPDLPSPQPTPVETQPMPTPEPDMPSVSPDSANRGNIYLNEISLLIRESYPVQVAVYLSGNLPTPCHHLVTEIQAPDDKNRIFVEVYTTVDPNLMCIQVLKPLEETVELGTFPTGHYTVWVNGEQIGEFDS